MSAAHDYPKCSVSIKSPAGELVERAENGDVEAAREILETFSLIVGDRLHPDGRSKYGHPDGTPFDTGVDGEYLAYLARCFTQFVAVKNGGAKELFTAMRLKGKKRGPKPDKDKARAERVIAMLMLRHRLRLEYRRTTEHISDFADALAARFASATVYRRNYEGREMFTIESENKALAYSFFVRRRLSRND